MAINFDEIQLIRETLHTYHDKLADLAAIFSFNNGRTLRLLFNRDDVPDIPSNGILTAKLADYSPQQLDGTHTLIISFADFMGLKWPDIYYPSRSNFYPLEHLLTELGLQRIVSQTKLNLAYTLFDDLGIEDELPSQERITWLRQISRLFNLSLPALLERHSEPGLLAIIPAKNFDDYLFSAEYRLVYVDDLTNTSLKTIPIDTNRQLCAAFDELTAFHDGIDAAHAGFLNLRKLMRRNVSASIINKTIRLFATWCASFPEYTNLARTLTAEYWLANQELEGLVGVVFPAALEKAIESGPEHYYYLTLPASKQQSTQYSSLATIDNVMFDSSMHMFSLPSVRPLLHKSEENYWMPLNTILLKLGQKQILAQNSFLTARFLKNFRDDSRLSLVEIANEAAFACDVFSLTNGWQWPHGNHQTQKRVSYENLFAIFDIMSAEESKLSPYYEALNLWWQFNDVDQDGKQNKAREQAAKIIEKLAPLIESESQTIAGVRPEITRLYIMAQAILDLLTVGIQPTVVREQLIAGEFTWILGNKVVRQQDEFNPNTNRVQTSPLFLTALGQFLDLAELAYNVRVKNEEKIQKIKQIVRIGQTAGKQVGVDFNALVSRATGEPSPNVASPKTMPHVFMMPHEQAWLNSVYMFMMHDYLELIVNLNKRPPITWQISPEQITQYAPTTVRLTPTHQDNELLTGLEITLINSTAYNNLDRISRHMISNEGFVKFDNVSFNKAGNIPVFFHYKYKDKDVREESWVQVIELGTSFAQKRNPYAYGDAIKHPNRFYGLRTELQTFIGELRRSTQDERQNFHLWGMRRSGKTSLLYMIDQIVKQPEIRRYFNIPEEWDNALDNWHSFVYVLQRISKSPDKVIDSNYFFQALIQRLCESLQWDLNRTDTLLAEMRDNVSNYGEVSAAKTALQLILDTLSSTKQIVVLLDEFDVILGQGDTNLFGHFRSVILDQELTRITWVITSWRGLYDDQKTSYESPFFNILRKVSPRPLIPEEARRQVLEQARAADIYFLPDAVDYVLEQSGRQPYFLQATCSHIVDYMNQKRLTHISLHTAKEALVDLLRPGSDVFDQCQYLWEPVPNDGKLLLCLLAQKEDIPSNEEIRNIMKSAGRPIWKYTDEVFVEMRRQFALAYEDLLKTILIVKNKDSSYRFTIPLLHRWLKRGQHLEELIPPLISNSLEKAQKQIMKTKA